MPERAAGIGFDLQGTIALVTGAGSGIGAATARRLAAAGAAVAVTDIDEAAGRRAVDEITDAGGTALFVALDVADPAAVARGCAEVREALGAPTVVVNNAFAASVGPFLESTPASIERTFGVIAVGTMNVCREVLPAMLDAGGGAIVNVLSEAGRIGEEGMSVYASAKAAVGGFTKSLAREVGPRGVRVNAVSPGTTLTPAVTTVIDEPHLERMARRYPLRRLGDPDEIADGILFLASPRSSWVTGQILSVSGGWSMV